MTFKDVIDEAFSPELEKWINTKIQTATTENNQIDLQNLKSLQQEIVNQKAKIQQQLQQKNQQPVQQAAKQAQMPNVQPTQTAVTAQLSHA